MEEGGRVESGIEQSSRRKYRGPTEESEDQWGRVQ